MCKVMFESLLNIFCLFLGLFLEFFGIGNGTHDLTIVRQVLCCRTISQPFMFMLMLFITWLLIYSMKCS